MRTVWKKVGEAWKWQTANLSMQSPQKEGTAMAAPAE
jgi:hypothetical protein